MALTQITDFVARVADAALKQYQGAPKLQSLLAQLATRAGDVEGALFGMVAQFDVTQAEGVWLDYLGKIVGEQRQGLNDTDYRGAIEARIVANGSNGTINDLLLTAHKWLDSFGADSLLLVDAGNACCSIYVSGLALGGQTGDGTLNRLLQFLRAARSAGVRLDIFYQDDVDAEEFVCGDVPGGSNPTGKGFDDSGAPNDPTAGRLAGVALT